MNLTAADVETLGVSDLKKELAARGLRTTGEELQLQTRLTDYLRIDFEDPYTTQAHDMVRYQL